MSTNNEVCPRVRFDYAITTVIRLTRNEVAVLRELCKSHYDREVRNLSEGALRTAQSDLDWDKVDSVEAHFSHRELGAVCKGTESVLSTWVDRPGNAGLHQRFCQLLREADAEWSRLNKKGERP